MNGSARGSKALGSGREPLLSATQLAQQLSVSRRWIYAQVEQHGLPAYKIGKSLAFEVSAVRAWLAAQRIGDWPEDCGPIRSADFISDTMERQGG